MAWTRFMDMSSGGDKKLHAAYIFIEATQEEAERIFVNRFGRNPHNITCGCCGEDYSIDESVDLAQATAYDRGCDYDTEARRYVEAPCTRDRINPYISLEDYVAKRNAETDPYKNHDIIFASEIKEEELVGGPVPKYRMEMVEYYD